MPELFQRGANGHAGTPRVLVLAYHAITPSWRHPLAIHPDRLREQLHRLAERGFRGTTFTDAATGEAGGRLVAVTFDDAFRSAANWGARVLEELGWPATVFTVTDTADSGEPMRWLERRETAASDEDLLAMPWSDLRELAQRGWEIGSHSTSHRLLSELDDTELEDELSRSRAEIAAHIGPCTSISYPWGEVAGRVVAAARDAGYTAGSGLAGRFHPNDPMVMPRFAVSAADGRFRYGLKTSSFLWNLRATPVWSWLDSVRHVPIGGS